MDERVTQEMEVVTMPLESNYTWVCECNWHQLQVWVVSTVDTHSLFALAVLEPATLNHTENL